jgi:alpha-beta hydrolase superfamily lysophospholipase
MLKGNLYEWIKTPELAQALFLNSETNMDIAEFHKKLVRESAYPFSHLFPFAKSNPDKSPVLVISGEKDAFFTVEEENITAKKFGAKNIVIKGQAHNLMMESAQEQVANIIDNWITNELQLP